MHPLGMAGARPLSPFLLIFNSNIYEAPDLRDAAARTIPRAGTQSFSFPVCFGPPCAPCLRAPRLGTLDLFSSVARDRRQWGPPRHVATLRVLCHHDVRRSAVHPEGTRSAHRVLVEEDEHAFDGTHTFGRDQALQNVLKNTEVCRMELAGANSKKQRHVTVESKCPALLAKFCDQLPRKSQFTNSLTSDEIDKKLNNVLPVLEYVNSHGVIARYDKTHVSRRLILDLRAAQEKKERTSSTSSQKRHDGVLRERILRMLHDIEMSQDLDFNYKTPISANNDYRALADHIHIKILNAGAW